MMKEEQLGNFAQMSSMVHKPFLCVVVLNSIETEDRTLVSFLDHMLSVVCKFYTFHDPPPKGEVIWGVKSVKLLYFLKKSSSLLPSSDTTN